MATKQSSQVSQIPVLQWEASVWEPAVTLVETYGSRSNSLTPLQARLRAPVSTVTANGHTVIFQVGAATSRYATRFSTIYCDSR